MQRLFGINSSPLTHLNQASQLTDSLIDNNEKMAAPQPFEFQLSSVTQLNVVDKLRELGVGDFVALPQLVAVGDQSSGKSSVLEAFLGIPFARDQGLCTRFPTQITMRRTDYEKIAISIIPQASASAEKVAKLRAFKKEGLTSLDGQEFLEIFQEASIHLIMPNPDIMLISIT
jgi:hypothetical protein